MRIKGLVLLLTGMCVTLIGATAISIVNVQEWWLLAYIAAGCIVTVEAVLTSRGN